LPGAHDLLAAGMAGAYDRSLMYCQVAAAISLLNEELPEQYHHKFKSESADKPGSVVSSHSSGTSLATRLARPTREPRGPRVRGMASMPPYLVLLRTGFTLPPPLPEARCALTAPFHPYPAGLRTSGRYLFCGTFHGLAPSRRYLASCPVEPGLSSLPIRRSGQRLPGQLRILSLVNLNWIGYRFESAGYPTRRERVANGS